jgi:anaerobic selenocysteine-containing dehydrogenase
MIHQQPAEDTVAKIDVAEVKASVCPFDCADTCSLNIEVKDNEILRVRGSRDNPFTQGKICSKVSTYLPGWVHGPQRIKYPMRRTGNKGCGHFTRITWEEAYSEIRTRFDEIIANYSSEAIVPYTYGGPMGNLGIGSMARRFFNKLGASDLYAASLCAGITGEAWESILGDAGGISHIEIGEADLMVVWGNNITRTHLHLIKHIRNARKRGAKLVVIDPKRIRIADDADLFLQPKPGTDVVLALAVANCLNERDQLNKDFISKHVEGAAAYLEAAAEYPAERAAEICGVPVDDIRKLAELWAVSPKTVLSMGIGLERTRNGGAAVRSAMALPVLMGNFGQRGTGICDSGGYFDIDSDYLTRPDLRPQPARTINTMDLASKILNPAPEETPIKSVFVYNHNPVAVVPNQLETVAALNQEDLFAVGFDLQMTDTMNYMDIVLPACSPFEYDDIYTAYGHSYLQRSKAVIPPVAEARPNTQVFRELAAKFEFDDDCFEETDEQMIERASTVKLSPGEVSDGEQQAFAESVFRNGVLADTPSGKACLADDSLRGVGEYTPRYKPLPSQQRQFTLISPASSERINSSFGGDNQPVLKVEINPGDATVLNINDGDEVVLSNDMAEVQLGVTISDRIQPGVLYVDKGAWMAQSASSLSVNALIKSDKADLAEGACYYDTQVDLQKAM